MLTFNATPLAILFHLRALHSFISSKITSQIRVKLHKYPIDLYANFPLGKIVKWNAMYNNCQFTLNEEEFEGDLIHQNSR